MGTKVFVVTSGEYSDYHIEAIFSTKESAEKFLKELGSEASIEEYNLDECIGKVKVECYEVCLDRENGSLRHKQRSVTWSTEPAQEVLFDSILGRSQKSFDHAVKLAAEARQLWLRQRG